MITIQQRSMTLSLDVCALRPRKRASEKLEES